MYCWHLSDSITRMHVNYSVEQVKAHGTICRNLSSWYLRLRIRVPVLHYAVLVRAGGSSDAGARRAKSSTEMMG